MRQCRESPCLISSNEFLFFFPCECLFCSVFFFPDRPSWFFFPVPISFIVTRVFLKNRQFSLHSVHTGITAAHEVCMSKGICYAGVNVASVGCCCVPRIPWLDGLHSDVIPLLCGRRGWDLLL